MLMCASPNTVPTRPMTPGTSLFVRTMRILRGGTSTWNSPIRMMRIGAPGTATASTARSRFPAMRHTSSAPEWPRASDSRTDNSSPRSSASVRALMRFKRSLSTTPSSTPSAADERMMSLPWMMSGPSLSDTRLISRLPSLASTARATAAARRAAAIEGCSSFHSSPETVATLSDRESSPLSSASRTASATSTATFFCASAVDAPMCGVRSTLGVVRRGWSAASGSFSYTSSTAPATCPAAMASRSAWSFTIPQRTEPVLGDVGIEADDVHAERVRALRDFGADASHTDDAECASSELRAHQLRPVPPALAHRERRVRYLPQEPEHRSEEELSDGDRVPRRCIDDGDAQLRRLVHVDVVDADARAPHHLELLGGGEELRGDARRAAADERIVLADPLQELGR